MRDERACRLAESRTICAIALTVAFFTIGPLLAGERFSVSVPGWIGSMSFSPDGKRLALTISEGSNYRKLRKLVDRWVTLGMELSRLRLQEQREASPGATKRRRESQLSEENKA